MTAQTFSDALGEISEKYIMEAIAYEGKPIRWANHPIRHRVVQAAACLLLAALMGGTVLAISPEARAVFVGWIREVRETWFVYRYVGEDPTFSENVVYCPMWLPDGYEPVVAPELRDHVVAIYENQSNDIIIFNCYKNTESMNLQIGQQGKLLQQVYVGDIFAALYFDSVDGNITHLIWEDGEKGVIFWISSTLDGETMVKIAESVAAQEIPKPQVAYRPTWLPEGYSQSLVPDLEDQVNVLYTDDAGDIILFAYSNSSSSLYLFAQGETESFKVMVKDIPADFYFDKDTTEANYLVWESPENDLIYWIAANLSMDDMIKIAESVEVQEIPSQEVS